VRLFKSGQAGAYTAGYSSAMSIVRDDCGEHQIRVDRMIAEFNDHSIDTSLAFAAVVAKDSPSPTVPRRIRADLS
jgi:hypothetical protein